MSQASINRTIVTAILILIRLSHLPGGAIDPDLLQVKGAKSQRNARSGWFSGTLRRWPVPPNRSPSNLFESFEGCVRGPPAPAADALAEFAAERDATAYGGVAAFPGEAAVPTAPTGGRPRADVDRRRLQLGEPIAQDNVRGEVLALDFSATPPRAAIRVDDPSGPGRRRWAALWRGADGSIVWLDAPGACHRPSGAGSLQLSGPVARPRTLFAGGSRQGASRAGGAEPEEAAPASSSAEQPAPPAPMVKKAPPPQRANSSVDEERDTAARPHSAAASSRSAAQPAPTAPMVKKA